MKLSWIGRSAIVVAGVIVVALVGLQVFYQPFFIEFNGLDKAAALSFPLLVIASISSIVFLGQTGKMEKTLRSPWEHYSWFVLTFTSIIILLYGTRLFFFILGKPSSGLEMFLFLPMLITFIFTIIGLGHESNRPTGKVVKDMSLVFIVIGVVLLAIIMYTPLKKIPVIEKTVITTIIMLIPIYMCVSIIRKNDGAIKNIYSIILISQIIFFIIELATEFIGDSMLESLQLSALFLTFAVVFDLRTSLHLADQYANTENEQTKVVA